jgi:hypothetical protein
MVMATLFGLYPCLRKLYADGGYQGPLFRAALGRILRNLQIDIVKRSDAGPSFSRCCRSDGFWCDRYFTGGPEALADKPSRPDRVWNRIPASTNVELSPISPLATANWRFAYPITGKPSAPPARSSAFRWPISPIRGSPPGETQAVQRIMFHFPPGSV